MKAWQKLYENEVLSKARDLVGDVAITSNDGVEIIAEIDGYNVRTYIEYGSPSYLSCSCPSTRPCEHEAALVYYLIAHQVLYLKKLDFDDVFDLVSDDDLKRFLLEEFDSNPDLKNRFFERFSKSPIDKNHYQNKLSDIFKRGEGRDFSLHGFYDLDLMESELYDFLVNDIGDILSAGEHDFACDLLIKIAKLLNDEVMSTCDSWYNLVEGFMENENVLSFSIYLDSTKLSELYANMDHIMSCL